MSSLKKENLSYFSQDTATNDLYAIFKTNAEAIGAKVYNCPDPAAAIEQILEIARGAKAKEVAVANSPMTKQLPLHSMEKEGYLLSYENLLIKAKSAQIGISEVDYAVAETGSLCQDATEVNKRLVSSLPPIHIALVKKDNILNNFVDSIKLITEAGAKTKPGYYTFISGPSRTSDIERVLTIGVHGPKELHIIFI